MSKYIRSLVSASKKMMEREGGGKSPRGLWDNIRDKKARGGKMRKPGSPGAPTNKAIKDSQS